MTGGWAVYSWPPPIILVTVMMVFLLDFLAEQYVAKKYGFTQQIDVETLVTNGQADSDRANGAARQQPRSNDAISQEQERKDLPSKDPTGNTDLEALSGTQTLDMEERSFQQQIAAFLILEFGVIFHSVIIGLNLGTAGSEFSTLYAVLVFHQSFEGLGIGARMSAIPFPKRVSWLPWFLCTAYGLTTPISIAIGLGLRTTYNGGSYTANVVSGLLDAISAGILIYTGLVELLARDFLFNSELTRSSRRQAFMIFNVFLGAALMALLGKWAWELTIAIFRTVNGRWTGKTWEDMTQLQENKSILWGRLLCCRRSWLSIERERLWLLRGSFISISLDACFVMALVRSKAT